MENVWKTITTWLTENSVTEFVELNAGVTENEIKALEEIINTKLPQDFINFYKIHNGQTAYADYGLIDFQELLSFERIAEIWSGWNDVLNGATVDNTSNPESGIKDNWWNPLWIPVTASADGDVICIDLDPAEEGTKGQIIEVYHDDDIRILAANSFTEWIKRYAEKFEHGKMVFSESFGITDKETLKLMEEEAE